MTVKSGIKGNNLKSQFSSKSTSKENKKEGETVSGTEGILWHFSCKNIFSYVYIGGQKLKKLCLSMPWHLRAPILADGIGSILASLESIFFGP